jgi:TatD DNase family protein
MEYFDAHCHIQLPEYDTDREDVLARMQEAKVGGLVVGVDLESSEKALELVRATRSGNSPQETTDAPLYAAVGLHPNDIHLGFDEKRFAELAAQPEVLAIGECGLDYYRADFEKLEETKKAQMEIFEKHIDIAIETNKPLMIHARPSKGIQDAYHDALAVLKSRKRQAGDALKGNFHFFVGGIEEAKLALELDFTMSYTAVITFARDYDEVIRYLPLNNILTETDSPYVAPEPNRGRRNEPTAVRNVVQAIAEIRGEDEEIVRVSILENAKRRYGIEF